MSRSEKPLAGQDLLAFLAGGGEMGERIRGFDWSKTPLGSPEGWPQSLRSAVSILLPSKAQIVLFWGPDLTTLYNDAYRPVFGAKHPHALGLPARESWSELWVALLKELLEGVLATGEAYWASDRAFFVKRYGYLEETYFDVSYDPVRDESGQVGGVFCIVSETTVRVIGARRLKTLRDLSARTAAEAQSVEDACQAAALTLGGNPHDLPFVLLYLLDGDGRRAKLAGLTGLGRDAPASPAAIELDSGAAAWPFRQVAETGQAVEVTDLSDTFGPLPGGAWPESPLRAVVLPMAKPGQTRLAGFVVAGVSPRLDFNDDYRAFLDLLAGHVATSVANARAYEEERRRAEALAELDRAKTAFFSNVSHEFRTPLTLMLGPVEDLLTRSFTELSPAAKGQLEVVSRNGLRLLRLVNTLLDFSRIEAGRVWAVYQPTDLAAYTADLASNFRSACERAGLELVVSCPELTEPVFVDRGMWEKVVLNLVSNAFKFTFEGEIAVTLRQAGRSAELRVRDTGTGIPADQMPRLFERFHRVENARGRTHEGSGIGLALVQELVKLHGGSVTARSVAGDGTTFTVTLPLGSAHLPADQIGDSRTATLTGTGASPYVEEALRWLPDAAQGEGDSRPELPSHHEALPTPYRQPEPDPDDRPRVLVADDNADMRQYVARLLAEQFRTEAVPDGEVALAAARDRPPDLVLADVMMPKLDGFGLLKALRADPRTSGVPVIMLSARAGEESRVEGMEAGADDYLVKPFGARELLARVSAHLQIARLRREASESLRAQGEEMREAQRVAHVGSWRWDAATDVVTGSDELFRIYGLDPDTHAFPDFKDQDGTLYPPDSWQRINAAVQQTMQTGVGYELDVPALRNGAPIWITTRGEVVRDVHGKIVGLRGTVQDITDRKRAEEARRQAQEQVQFVSDAVPALISYVDRSCRYRMVNQAYKAWFGHPRSEVVGRHLRDVLGEAAWDVIRPHVEIALSGQAHTYEAFAPYKDGGPRWISVAYTPDVDERGEVRGFVGLVSDITQRKQMEEALKEADRRKDEFLAILAHELRNPLAPLRNGLQLLKLAGSRGDAVEQAQTMMERQLGQMVRLIDDLLDVSRISRGKITLQKERIELARAVQQAVETSRPLFEADAHDLTVTLPPQPVYLDADPLRLGQVFSNLLNNASKFTEPGGRIGLTAERQGRDVVVSVKDTGIGIPPDKIESIFEMFSQVDQTLERSRTGLGIGLTLVKRLVELHGGSVVARSDGPGRGSEFVVRLPVALEQPEPQPPEGAAEGPSSTGRRRILVVDDNRDSADSLAMLLKLTGNETHTAHDGHQAVEAAARLRPDVILLDIGLPKLNGYEACRRIRELPGGNTVVIIALTGWGQDGDRRKSSEAGFNEHLVKPVDHAALLRLLDGMQTART